MKKFLFIAVFLFTAHLLQGQIRGNGTTERIIVDVGKIISVYIGLYADVEIDCGAATSYLQIDAEENLMPFIERSMTDGLLKLDQVEWIQPTKRIKIRIGAPGLSSVVQSTHDVVRIVNMDGTEFAASADVGTIQLEGEYKILRVENELGKIDAQLLNVEQVFVSVTGRGTVLLSAPRLISGEIAEEGRVYFGFSEKASNTEVNAKGPVIDRFDQPQTSEFSTRFIDLRIKNNSWKHINAYVIGPKPDGKFFSYGFPMRPGQTRNERWTIGTKVYRKTALGTKKLLIEVTDIDENRLVKLHDNKN